MSESTEKANEAIDYAKLSNAGTSELVEELGKIRAAKKETTERINAEYEFPDSYNPKMGLKVGHVTELRIFFHVKPGHAEALKEELRKFKTDEERNSKLAYVATGIQDMSCTLFDDDTRYLHATTFDTDWDPYIDDSVPTPKQCLKYAKWLQHLEEAGDFGPDNLPTANDIKVLFNQQRETATVYLRSFGDTVVEQYRMKDLQQAFEAVLDHPDAADALSHPALAPLLELAAD